MSKFNVTPYDEPGKSTIIEAISAYAAAETYAYLNGEEGVYMESAHTFTTNWRRHLIVKKR